MIRKAAPRSVMGAALRLTASYGDGIYRLRLQ
jgi:hypothetical protein